MGYHDATMYTFDHGQHHPPEYSQFLAEHAQGTRNDEAGPKISENGGVVGADVGGGSVPATPATYRRVGRHRRRRETQPRQSTFK